MVFLAKRLGRYTSVVLFGGSFLIVALWLQLLNFSPITFLVLAPLVLLAFAAAFALLVGVLFVRLPDGDGLEVSREMAPQLWRMWDELDPPTSGTRRLLINADLNASISERKRWFGLFGRVATVSLGLELLILLDREMLRSVMAHEVGHARCQHLTGGTNLAEFLETFETLYEYADPGTTVVGSVADWALGAWLDRAQREMMRVSRENEFEADRFAANICGAKVCADAEVLIATASEAIAETVDKPLEQELLGAVKAPKPPLQRVFERRASIVSADTQTSFLQVAWDRELDENASHPPFRARFERVLPGAVAGAVAVGPSAATTCMSSELFEALYNGFCNLWVSSVEESFEVY